MELLIGIACIGATVYYFYLMANFFDTKIAMKQKERKRRANKIQLQMYKSRRRRWIRNPTNLLTLLNNGLANMTHSF